MPGTIGLVPGSASRPQALVIAAEGISSGITPCRPRGRCWSELVGGALLLIGLFSRPVSLVLTFNFFVAMFTVESKSYSFSLRQLAAQIWANQNPILGDTAFPFLATALIVLLFGPGWLSVDHWLSRRGQRAVLGRGERI